MRIGQGLLLLGGVYVAPHMTEPQGILFGAIAICLGLFFEFIRG